jgi:hypothetical protein
MYEVASVQINKNVGLWEINTDGTGLRQIAPFPDGSELSFALTAYTPSHIVSRDGSQYLITVGTFPSQPKGLFFGKLQDTAASPVPDTDEHTAAIGWSTF